MLLGEALGASRTSTQACWRLALIGGTPTMMRILPNTTVKRAGATGHSVRQRKEHAAKLATNFAVFPAGS